MKVKMYPFLSILELRLNPGLGSSISVAAPFPSHASLLQTFHLTLAFFLQLLKITPKLLIKTLKGSK